MRHKFKRYTVFYWQGNSEYCCYEARTFRAKSDGNARRRVQKHRAEWASIAEPFLYRTIKGEVLKRILLKGS